jgi:hypothetical protein
MPVASRPMATTSSISWCRSLRQRRIGRRRAFDDQCVGRLHEKEGRLGIGIVAHLARVLGVVATDAEDAADGKIAGPLDRHEGDERRKHEIGHGNPRLQRAAT